MGEEPANDQRPPPSEGAAAAWQETRAALRYTERRYRELVEYSLGLICIHDLHGTILSINPAAAASLGYRPQDGVGRNVREFLAPDKRPLFDEYLRRIERQGQDAGLMRVVSRTGAARTWMYRNVLTRDRSGSPYVLGHALDITERVEAERTLRESEQALRAAHAELETKVRERTAELEQANARLRVEIREREEAERSAQQANELKDEFLGTLSHELRTPLSAIFGWARILRGRQLEEGVARGIEVIERNAEVQIRLIDEVLDVARITAGKMTLALEQVNVAEILRATVESVRPTMLAKGITIEQRLADSLPVIHADPHRLQQVFWNLLSNALKFTGSHGRVTVTLRCIDGFLECQIADTGVGIRRSVLPFVFDRFRQADSSMTRSHVGLGLGLAIVRHIVELHHGSVSAASAGEGQGATFTVRLPCACGGGQAQTEDMRAEDEQWPTAALQGRTVLLVEDYQDARDLVSAVLEAEGARLLAASTATEAVEQARRVAPDVVVADLGLPAEDGFALLVRLRQMYPQVPAIALTAYARESDRERALAAGFQHYLIKPIDPRLLVRIIADTL